MTTATLLSDLAGVSYGVSGSTTEQRFQVHDEDFEDFAKFPLIVVESGPEDNTIKAGKYSEISFHPAVWLYCEDETAANMESYRDSIRNAILNNTTLRTDTFEVIVDKITPSLSPNRKLQRLKFDITLNFAIQHT